MVGWLKLHRKILGWDWYSDINVRLVFLHLLASANYKTTNWQGVEILSGQYVTTVSNLALQNGLTNQQTKTVLNKLQITNEITIKTTNKYSVITIVNWAFYQGENCNNNNQNNKPNNNQITNEQQTKQQSNNKQNVVSSYSNKEVKKLRTKEVKKSSHVMSSQSSHTTQQDGQDKTDPKDFEKLVKDNIGYKDFDTYERVLVDDLKIIAIILDVLMSENKTIRISGEIKQMTLVQAQFLKLDHEDILHTIKQYKSVTERITKTKQYILTILYNCTMERRAHEINHSIFDYD